MGYKSYTVNCFMFCINVFYPFPRLSIDKMSQRLLFLKPHNVSILGKSYCFVQDQKDKDVK